MSRDTELVDAHEMVVVHRVFRRELRLLSELILAAPVGDGVRAAVLANHLADVTGALHHHHTAEDTLLWPVLLSRIGANPLIARMQDQHERLAGLLERIETLNRKWRDTADATIGHELSGVLRQLSAALTEHMDDEEREILPLVSRHVTLAEWNALTEYGRRVIPKNSKDFVFVGLILEEASEAESLAFLRQMPAPIRWAWHLVGQRIHRRAVARIRGR